MGIVGIHLFVYVATTHTPHYDLNEDDVENKGRSRIRTNHPPILLVHSAALGPVQKPGPE